MNVPSPSVKHAKSNLTPGPSSHKGAVSYLLRDICTLNLFMTSLSCFPKLPWKFTISSVCVLPEISVDHGNISVSASCPLHVATCVRCMSPCVWMWNVVCPTYCKVCFDYLTSQADRAYCRIGHIVHFWQEVPKLLCMRVWCPINGKLHSS